MQNNKLEKTLKLLKNFSNKNIPLKESALRRMGVDEVIRLYDFLISSPERSKNRFFRPECPVKDKNHFSLAKYQYKKAMANYISQWGYNGFNSPSTISPTLLEATANYLEQN
jgi:hypothetical protein